MSRAKLHHYIPQFYLKYFADDAGFVYTYDREDERYLRLPPQRIAAENNFYTLFDAEGQPHTVIEDLLANLVEGPVKPIIDKLAPGWDPTETAIGYLALFVSFQRVRVPGVHGMYRALMTEFAKEFTRFAFSTRERVEASFAEMRRETGKQFDVDPQALVEFVRSGEWDVTVERHAILKSMLDTALDLVPLIAALNWTFLAASQGRTFVTSDEPFTIVPPPDWPNDAGVGLLTPGAIKYFPLTSRLCLRMGDRDPGLSWRTIDGAVVRTINANIAANSDRFIFASSEPNLRRTTRTARAEAARAEGRTRVETIEAGDGARYMVDSFLSAARFYREGM